FRLVLVRPSVPPPLLTVAGLSLGARAGAGAARQEARAALRGGRDRGGAIRHALGACRERGRDRAADENEEHRDQHDAGGTGAEHSHVRTPSERTEAPGKVLNAMETDST